MDINIKTTTALFLLGALCGCATPAHYDASNHFWCTFQDTQGRDDSDITEEIFPGSSLRDRTYVDECANERTASYEEQREQLKQSIREQKKK